MNEAGAPAATATAALDALGEAIAHALARRQPDVLAQVVVPLLHYTKRARLEGMTPEQMLIALKGAIRDLPSYCAMNDDGRDRVRDSIVSAAIRGYFAAGAA